MKRKKHNIVEVGAASAVPVIENVHDDENQKINGAQETNSESMSDDLPATISLPALSDPGVVDADRIEVIDAENVHKDEENNADKTKPLQAPRLWYPLTADTLFRQALNISAGDPARMEFGYFYEAKLKRECAITLEFPIYKNDLRGLRIAIWRRRQNWGFFRCSAIDAVLYAYWNMLTKGPKQ